MGRLRCQRCTMSDHDDKLREQAVLSLKKKRGFQAHIVVYVAVNALLIVVWALGDRGFFWPVFPLVGWGIGLVFHAMDAFARLPSEEAVEREMERLRRAR